MSTNIDKKKLSFFKPDSFSLTSEDSEILSKKLNNTPAIHRPSFFNVKPSNIKSNDISNNNKDDDEISKTSLELEKTIIDDNKYDEILLNGKFIKIITFYHYYLNLFIDSEKHDTDFPLGLYIIYI